MFSRAKLIWIMGFMFLVLLMISVGGITRLTRSGLSIVEWRPIVGTLPPLSEKAWEKEFQLYQATPEYEHVNSHFSLQDYKRIYFWEYVHRNLGRFIFLYILIPGLLLWRRKKVEGSMVLILAGLVATQGLVGWLMVKSGLSEKPHVSPYLLTLHFSFALFVLVYAYREISLIRKPLAALSRGQMSLLRGFGGVLFLQVIFGCLTSGLKAGHYSNAFPLMGGRFFPQQAFVMEPSWLNFFENPILVQWVHRWLGISTLLLLLVTSFQLLRHAGRTFIRPLIHLISIMTIQIVIGILNLRWAVPVPLAVAHQFFASLIVLGYFNLYFRTRIAR